MLLLFWFVPLTAWANAGTGLMWATMLHMFIGNAVIGIGEGTAVSLLFRLNLSRCMLAMVAANYFSAWCGVLFLQKWILPSLSLDLYNGWHWLRLMVGITFILTLVLEWPFVLLCLGRTPGRFKEHLGQSGGAIIELSVVVLVVFIGQSSGTLHTDACRSAVRVVVARRRNGIYISATNGNVCSLNLSTRQTGEVFPLHSTNRDARLFVRLSAFQTNRWDVLADSQGNVGEVMVCSNLPVTAVEFQPDTPESRKGTWSNFGEAPKLGSATKSDWNFEM